MRSERKREERQLREEKKKKAGCGICRFISIVYILALAAFIGLIVWLNVLPEKYLYGAIGILVFISIFIFPVMFSRRGKKGRKVVATIIAVLLIGVFGVGTYYLADTLNFLSDITETKVHTDDYYLVVKSDSLYDEVNQVAGITVGTLTVNDMNYSEAKAELQNKVDVEYAYIQSSAPSDLINSLLTGEYEAVFISAASYEGLKNEDENLDTTTKVLYTVALKVQTEDQTSAVKVTKEPFNIYVSGIDVAGNISTVSRSDVNMIVTVNPVTNQVLLTSIPRDYYVNLPSKGAMDKLTHSGLYGVQETIAAVEEMMGIDINYYVRVNYTTVVKLVDAMGGIDIESPYAFTTHGMHELNGIQFVKGQNHLTGNMALAYSRERKSWPDGDMRRNENQQLVLEAIIRKATSSSTILTKYTSLLDAVKGNMETNMTQDEMASLVKMQLARMPEWNIEKQALKGVPNCKMCYALGYNASVVDPDAQMVVQAADQIAKVMNGEDSEKANEE